MNSAVHADIVCRAAVKGHMLSWACRVTRQVLPLAEAALKAIKSCILAVKPIFFVAIFIGVDNDVDKLSNIMKKSFFNFIVDK